MLSPWLSRNFASSIQMVLSDPPGPAVLMRLIAVAATRQQAASSVFRQPTGPLSVRRNRSSRSQFTMTADSRRTPH